MAVHGAPVRRRRRRAALAPPAGYALGEQLTRIVPVCAVAAAAFVLAWRDYGSVLAGDWLPYALLAGLVLVASLLAVRIGRPTRGAAAALAAVVALAAFDALSIAWSEIPASSRDEALLVLFYAAAFAVAVLTIRAPSDRAYAVGAVALGAGGMAVATAFKLRFGARPGDFFFGGRLDFPVSYVNAQAAAMLLGFWPAVATAARRSSHVAVRALATGSAAALLAGWLLTQSKGGAVGLAVSTIAVMAASPARLRLLVPVLIAAALAGAGSVALTAPFRADTQAALEDAVRHGATILLVLAAIGIAVGALYAAVDRRLTVSPRAERTAGRLAAACLAAGLVSLVGVWLASHPIGFVEAKWRSFKVQPAHETGASHLLALGSNRYDMWRVAGSEFVHHPLIGVGARGFGPAYLEHRRSDESPIRAHSLELDTLAETGLVGFGLLAAALGIPLALAVRRARAELSGAAALGTGAYFLGHATVDWIWTFPAVGVLVFLLLGIGSSSARRGAALRSRGSLLAAAAVLVLAIVAFLPPWLAARYNDRAGEGGAGAAGDLRWAKRLDPLSPEPYVTQWQLANTPAERLAALRGAVAREPSSYVYHYLLGVEYTRARRSAAARRELEVAFRLNPTDPYVSRALKELRKG